jgi:hypothetical protein
MKDSTQPAARHLPVKALIVAVCLVAGWLIQAQPVRDRIIASALLKIDGEQTLLDVQLTFPFRYLSHFPPETGEELRIRILPVSVPSSDLGAVLRREGVTPPDADIAAIDEVIYEGDSTNGPWLTIRFTRPVRYQVIPGSDYRSVTIAILELR